MKKYLWLIAGAISFGTLATEVETTVEKAQAKQEVQQKTEAVAKKLQAKKAEIAAAAKQASEKTEEQKK